MNPSKHPELWEVDHEYHSYWPEDLIPSLPDERPTVECAICGSICVRSEAYSLVPSVGAILYFCQAGHRSTYVSMAEEHQAAARERF